MSKILVQQSHDIQYPRIVEIIEEFFVVLEVKDEDLQSSIDQHQHEIAGFIVFHLNDKTTMASDLLTNERFNSPSTPILYFGRVGPQTSLPYGMQAMDAVEDSQILESLEKPRKIPILVVEDDDGIMDVLTISLSKYFDVHSAIDGTKAIERLASQMFDLVILDLMLPGDARGEDVFKYVKTHHENTPVVIITAHDSKQRELEFTFGDADGYVPKPWGSNAKFRQLLMKAIKTRHAKTITRSLLSNTQDSGDENTQYIERMRSYT
ncbi:response regulator [bacterium]|nr:response regulator [bacterium]